jgi:hypothetical protein
MADFRDTGRMPTLLGLDGRLAIPLLLLLYRPMSLWLWGAVLSLMIIFYAMRVRGLSTDAAVRRLRARIAGPDRRRRSGRYRPRSSP